MLLGFEDLGVFGRSLQTGGYINWVISVSSFLGNGFEVSDRGFLTKFEFLALMDKEGNESGSCLFRRLIRRQVSSSASEVSTEGVNAAVVEEASSSRTEEEYVRYNRSLLSLQPWIFRKANFTDDWEGTDENGNFLSEYDNQMNALSPKNRGPRFRLGNDRHSGGSWQMRRYYVEPLNSVENCFVSQLSNQYQGVDDYVFSPPSLVATMRPSLITDENRIISRSCDGSSAVQQGIGQHEHPHCFDSSIQSETLSRIAAGGVSSRSLEALIGVPPLPESRKNRRKIRGVQNGRLGTVDSPSSDKISEGSLDGIFHFCLGFSFGMMFTLISNRAEKENLHTLLKQSQDLVQDLQDELEMNDSLAVKEVVNETHRSQEIHQYCFSRQEYIDLLPSQNQASLFTSEEKDETDSHGPVGNPQSLSKIEADLEAELERLEQNIIASDLQRRMSGLSEIDLDLMDVVQGELRADLVDRDNSDTDGSSTAGTHKPNYSVCPKELSLRLHEVIQTRLEERIAELESELWQNRRQPQTMEAERLSFQRAFSNSDIGSSSNQESPTVLRSDNPFRLNLSGDALLAYEEAYEEFAKITETKTPPSSLKTSKWVDVYMVNQSDQNQIWELEGSKRNRLVNDKVPATEATWEPIFSRREYNDLIEEGQEVSDDEEGRRLIERIMEKTRKGSPAVMYAQRMLSLMDEVT